MSELEKIQVTGEQVQAIWEDKNSNKSQKFLKMYDLGLSIADISKFTGSHYSFVYGVISAKRELTQRPDEPSRADQFRAEYDAGKTIGQIAKDHNANYSYVFAVIKKHRLQHGIQPVPTEDAAHGEIAATSEVALEHEDVHPEPELPPTSEEQKAATPPPPNPAIRPVLPPRPADSKERRGFFNR